MGTFDNCFLFFDNPRGGVEHIQWMHDNAPWVKAVFLNVNPYTPEQWEATAVIPECKRLGIIYGPWARTWTGERHPDGTEKFDRAMVDLVDDVMSDWNAPGIVNPEKEMDGHQDDLNYIASTMNGKDYALSVQPIPFGNIDWNVVKDVPILPQIMPKDQGRTWNVEEVRNLWWSRGPKCIYMTYESKSAPTDFILKASYSIFTGDPLMAGFTLPAWAPTSTGWKGCNDQPIPVPPEDDMAVGVVRSCKLAYQDLLESSAASNWRKDNPGELAKIEAYANSPADTPPPTGIKTEFGKGLIHLIDARKYADGTHS